MTREEFIKQRCEIDKINLEEFEKKYRVVDCNCGEHYCNGYRCLDLDGLLKENQELKQKLDKYENPEDMTLMMLWCTEKVKDENQKLQEQLSSNTLQLEELKKQVEEYKKKLMVSTKMEMKEIDKNTFVGIDYFQDKCIIYKKQQKEFIKYLKDESKEIYRDGGLRQNIFKQILQKYKEIIGSDK